MIPRLVSLALAAVCVACGDSNKSTAPTQSDSTMSFSSRARFLRKRSRNGIAKPEAGNYLTM
jgi:hypothetical protein